MSYCTIHLLPSYFAQNETGRKGADGKIIPGTSLRLLLAEEEDFKNESTQIEYIGKTCGIHVYMSPKGHPEIAGMGIENIWAAGKQTYRAIPLSEKKDRDKFLVAWDSAFSSDTLNWLVANGCRRKAQNYMLAYLTIHLSQSGQKEFDEDTINQMLANPDAVAMANVEGFRKIASKTHRNCLDFSGKEIKLIQEESKRIMQAIDKYKREGMLI